MPHGLASRLEPQFAGDIGATIPESHPWWPTKKSAAAPNVVVVVLDDVGFAQFGCYGSSISTPNIDSLADGGIRYSNFHVAALCSPTRASLLTGRNHHSVGVGFLGAFDTGFPNYRGAISPAAATMAEMLKAGGYSSYAVGKWHLTPPTQMSPAGPFDQWPTQRGFDRYYGYLWGEDDQFTPELWYDQHRVEVPDRADYHFSEDMTDRAIEFISDHVTNSPDSPFFAYVAFGACHAPHQAPREYIDRYAGSFDEGWDVERQRVLDRQIEAGLVPAGTKLSELNPGVPAWHDLNESERRLYSRLQEAFAGFMDHTDDQIGRLVSFLKQTGLYDNTAIVVMSDNGASGEGGRDGTINEYRYFLGLEDSIEDSLAAIDDIGGPATHNQYPAGWAQAGNTPLKYYKRFAHGGGVRAPLIVHWPKGVRPGGVRHQFHHVIDILPTILDIAGVDAPKQYKGVDQIPVHGSSMRYSFGEAEEPSTHRVQYFETAGSRGIYSDGWKAIAAHQPGQPFDEDHWELYNLSADFSESNDLSGEQPQKVAALHELWWDEARTHGVLPLDDRMGERVRGLDPAMDRRSYAMLPGTRYLNHVVGPSFSERGFTVSATMNFCDGDEGVLLAYGRRAFGFSFFVKQKRLVFDYNLAGRHTTLTGDQPIPHGASTLQLIVAEAAGTVIAQLLVDGRVTAEGTLPQLIPGGIGTLSIQCGHNSPSAVSAEYLSPFAFTGDLTKVVIDLDERTRDTSTADIEAEIAFQ